MPSAVTHAAVGTAVANQPAAAAAASFAKFFVINNRLVKQTFPFRALQLKFYFLSRMLQP